MPKLTTEYPEFIGAKITERQALTVRELAERQRCSVSEVVRIALDRLAVPQATNGAPAALQTQ